MSDKLKKIVIGPGTLVYPKVSKPDTYGEFADNKYKTDIRLSAEAAKPAMDAIKAVAKERMPSLKAPKMPWKIDEETGDVIFRAKSGKKKDSDEAQKPLIVDSKNKKLPEGVLVGGGTVARIEVAISTYTKKKPTGCNLYLNAVQVIELSEYQGREQSPFDEVDDGYVAEASSEEASPFEPADEDEPIDL